MSELAPVPTPSRPRPAFGVLGLAAVASISAGAIHATAIGAHGDVKQTAYVFAATAFFQIGWGALALYRPSRLVAAVGAAGNALCLVGWVVARSVGIGFIDGMETVEDIGTADALAAALAAISVLAALAVVFGVVAPRPEPSAPSKLKPALVGGAAVLLAAAALPGMVSASTHGGGGGHAHGAPAVIPPVVFDPASLEEANARVDLSGVEGVTPEQEEAAEDLVMATIEELPAYEDTATAYADGFRSIGDSVTGVEHYVNQAYLDDEHELDPAYPESLVYRVDGDERVLEAAMYMLTSGKTLDDVPELGGPMTQWHIHDNLCYTPDPVAPQVAGVVPPENDCPSPLVRGQLNPMIHVWIVGNECGPFAALEGVGAGQIQEGEERLCDHVNAEEQGIPLLASG